MVEFEKAFSRFADRAVAANDSNRLHAGTQSGARRNRRVSGRCRFVCLILDAGGVKFSFDRGPQAPRTRGAVVDDDEALIRVNLWPKSAAGPSATRRQRQLTSARHGVNCACDLRIAVVENLRRRPVTVSC